MNAIAPQEQLKALISAMFKSNDVPREEIERMTDEASTIVMQSALPGEVISIDALEQGDAGHICKYRRRMAVYNPEFPRAVVFGTEPAHVALNNLKAWK